MYVFLTGLEIGHFLQPEENAIQHTQHCEDTTHNGTELCHEVQKGHADATGLDHEGGQLVHEENTR